MASINSDPNERRTIQFVASDGSCKTIRLGNATARQAENVKGHVEKLAQAIATGDPVADETAKWAAEKIGDKLHARLAAVGLVKPPGVRVAGRVAGQLECHFRLGHFHVHQRKARNH